MSQMLTDFGPEWGRYRIPSWFSRPIGPGDTGPDVKVALRKLGLDPEQPYGDLAVVRVKGMARRLGFYNHDGILDEHMAAVLGEAEITKAGAMPAWFCLKLGDSGTQVAAAAKLLGVDGIEFGVEMEDAVRRFQSSRRIEPTGTIDAETAMALGEL